MDPWVNENWVEISSQADGGLIFCRKAWSNTRNQENWWWRRPARDSKTVCRHPTETNTGVAYDSGEVHGVRAELVYCENNLWREWGRRGCRDGLVRPRLKEESEGSQIGQCCGNIGLSSIYFPVSSICHYCSMINPKQNFLQGIYAAMMFCRLLLELCSIVDHIPTLLHSISVVSTKMLILSMRMVSQSVLNLGTFHKDLNLVSMTEMLCCHRANMQSGIMLCLMIVLQIKNKCFAFDRSVCELNSYPKHF